MTVRECGSVDVYLVTAERDQGPLYSGLQFQCHFQFDMCFKNGNKNKKDKQGISVEKVLKM